jgi:hypothetical protein
VSRSTASVLAALALALVAAPAANAATATIDGSPLNITASDIGSIQVTFDGSTAGEFTPQPSQPAYAGFTASLRRNATGTFSGFSYTAGGGFLFTPASPAPTVTGDGGQTSPFILTANFDAIAAGIPFAHVTEQIIYVNNSSTVQIAYSVVNATPDGSSLDGRFFESADLNVGGNGSGTGTFSASPIRQVGGVNPTTGRSVTLFEVTPWTHYMEDANSTVQNIVNSNAATPPSLPDTINPNVVDNGVAVQWDLASLGPGEGTGEAVVWNFGTTTTAPPPPVPGQAVNVNVVSGQVRVKVPGGKFVPLTNNVQIPVGSQLDTRKGRVKLTSAATIAGKTQTSDFYDGTFQIKQSVPKKSAPLVTDIVLKGQASRASCSLRSVDKKKGPKSVLGKLWGSGKGKFRTSGKYASATVRGTIWLTQDECDGTLIRVKRGTVQVRDLRRHKTVTVKAGHSYLARARK